MDRIIEVAELEWSFSGSPPTARIQSGRSVDHIAVDPTPCYHHDPRIVEEVLAQCELRFPLPTPVKIYNIHFENMGRTNGETRTTSNWIDEERDAVGDYISFSFIMLFGKRTPIHPAVTRALVAHEYGHAVDAAISQKRFKGSERSVYLREEYRAMRGLRKRPFYGPGTWDEQPAELLANDFRVLVMGIETEFWPHPVPPPTQVLEVVKWWDEAKMLDLSMGTFKGKSES